VSSEEEPCVLRSREGGSGSRRRSLKGGPLKLDVPFEEERLAIEIYIEEGTVF
jgi:hypothetical protein